MYSSWQIKSTFVEENTDTLTKRERYFLFSTMFTKTFRNNWFLIWKPQYRAFRIRKEIGCGIILRMATPSWFKQALLLLELYWSLSWHIFFLFWICFQMSYLFLLKSFGKILKIKETHFFFSEGAYIFSTNVPWLSSSNFAFYMTGPFFLKKNKNWSEAK